MKKILLKSFILVILFQLCICIQVFAADSFRIRFQEELSVNAGDIIEVPIIIDNIDFNGIQKGISSFSCKLDYDKNVFELVNFENNETFKINENIEMYVQYVYNSESNILVLQFSNADFQEFGGEYVDNYLEIGKVKVKAKEGILTGAYNLSITDVEGGNTETSITVSDYESKLYVVGTEIVEEDKTEDENIALGGTEKITTEAKKTIVSITQNDEGTQLYIKPDNENGVEIGKVVLENTELVEKDGVFTANVTPGNTYLVDLYDVDGGFIGTQFVTVGGKVDEIVNSGNPVEDTEDGENSENAGNNGEDSKPGDDGDKDNNSSDNSDKTEEVPTGDRVIVPVCIVLTIVVLANLMIWWAKIRGS